MRKFDLYEFTAILIPGAVLIYGIASIFPQLGPISPGKETSTGDLGIALMLAYPAGHLIQGLGKRVEKFQEWMYGGRPSDQLRRPRQEIVGEVQMKALPRAMQLHLGLDEEPVIGDLGPEEWRDCNTQMRGVLQKAGRHDRVESNLGSYGLLRGLTAALLVLLPLFVAERVFHHPLSLIKQIAGWLTLIVLIVASFCRMRHFSVLYTRELMVQFLLVKPTDGAKEKKDD